MKLDVKKVKIQVTVPTEQVERIRNAICEEGAGVMGQYTYCSISTKCIGTFKGSENTHPFIGQKNKLEMVNEEKLDVICDITMAKKVLKKLREIHPYEEPGISIIPLIEEEDLK